jgi:hypothetical protein
MLITVLKSNELQGTDRKKECNVTEEENPKKIGAVVHNYQLAEI